MRTNHLPPGASVSLRIERLRCEYRSDPLAIEAVPPRLSWVLVSSRRRQAQTAYRILVASSLETLETDHADLWDSGRVVSDQTLHIPYAGQALSSRQQCWWKVQVWDQDGQPSPWSGPATWRMGLLAASDWQAQWIAATSTDDPEPVMLRRDFSVQGPLRRAMIHSSGLGLYELHLNGRRIGDARLAPECTLYRKRIQYQSYDVTRLLHPGINVLTAYLAEGWYAGTVFLRDGAPGSPLCLLAQLEMERPDGHTETVVTDSSWRVKTGGPLVKSGIYAGETYDARREEAGWHQADFVAEGWAQARIVDPPPDARLVAQPNEPIRVTQEILPIQVVERGSGTYVIDFGQNLVGWCRLAVTGPAGTTITLRHGEMLDEGNVYTRNLRGARQEDSYILRGGGPEVWEPRFTYHGFRYVEVTGWPGALTAGALVARVVHSDAAMTGRFACSHPLLTRLMDNIVWTQRGNLLGMPTDCPQRDERLGWCGDIHAFAQTAIFTMDLGAFFTKWLADLRDSQAADGRFPDFAPSFADVGKPYRNLPPWRGIFAGVPAWGDAGTVVPWRAYVNYADPRLLAEHFTAARRWVDIIHQLNPGLLWEHERGNDYGDWLNGDVVKIAGFPQGISEVPKAVLATAFFAHSADLVARMARVLGRSEDAVRFARLHRDIAAAFRSAYVDAETRIRGDTQAGYALALHFGLLTPDQRPQALSHLLTAITRYHGHASTGIQATHRMLLELSANGQHELAYRLATLRDAPSWGYSIDQGATTIWERWDGYVAGRGFQDPGMNSFNHYALGSVGEWMWRELVGIHPDEERPGFRHVIIRPRPAGDLTWVKATYDSIRGPISVHWHLTGDRMTLEVNLPAHVTATIHVPTCDPARVSESGVLTGTSVCEVGSGVYRFEAPWAANDGR